MKKLLDTLKMHWREVAVGVSAGIMYLPECYNSMDDYARMLAPMVNIMFCSVHIRGEGAWWIVRKK